MHCNELGVTTVYRSDEYGFNNPAGLWEQAPLEVLLVGDSFVQGACVPPDQTLAAVIRKAYPRTVSLGRDGAGPLLQLAALREYARYLRPAAIVWVYTEENDLADLLVESRYPTLTAYLRPDFSQGLFERQAVVGPIIDQRIDELLDQYQARRWIPLRAVRQMLYNRAPPPNPVISIPPREGSSTAAEPWVFAEALRLASLEAEALRARRLFVFLPSYGSFSGRSPSAETARMRVLEEAERVGFTTLDVESLFRAAGDTKRFFPFELYGHFTPQGYALIGQEVAAKLASSDRQRPR